MKALLIATAIAAGTASAANAQTVNAKVEDHYRTVVKQVPHVERVCETVEVPIYGYSGGGASAGDVLGGMILGGLIGKGASGDDKGAAAGAVIGGMIGADRNRGREVITGYRLEDRCFNETTYERYESEVYSHSTITFKDNGRNITIQFQR